MPARRKTNDQTDPTIPSLTELLQEGETGNRDSFASGNPIAITRLVHAVTSLGGMVTFWDDRTNGRLCFSMRLGSLKRSYNLDTVEELEHTIEGIVGKFSASMRSHKIVPPPLLSSYTPPDKPTPIK